MKKTRLIALDLDGTLTQHKHPMEPQIRAALTALSSKYRLLMVGAGQVYRIFNQMEHFPIDIIGNYGMQYAKYNADTKDLDIIYDHQAPFDREYAEKTVTALRSKYGFTEFAGDNVEYHPSGCLTFPILGTKAAAADKLVFDPDRSRRRPIYPEVVEAFPDYHVFIGGSSSFDLAPKPYNKYYALDLYCRENGYDHDEVIYIGDDYGPGGNDESVYLSDFPYLTIDDYRTFPQVIAHLLPKEEPMNYWTLSKKNIYVAAHRGFSEEYPENTMEAFLAAEALGVDQIETDVRISKDGELVLIHDATLDRTTNGTGLVCDMTLAQLKELDAGSHKGPQFAGCKIPTLREFMEHFKNHPTITLDLELKEYPSNSSTPEEDREKRDQISYSVCDRVLEMVREYGFEDRIVINTFSAKLHEYIYKTYGRAYRQHVFFPLANMGETTIDPYSYAYCCCMFASVKGHRMAEAEDYREMTDKGVSPWAGASVKDAAGVDECIEKGAELITCNNPDVILNLLRERGYHK